MLFLLWKQTVITSKNQLMSKVLTKQVQNKISRYFLWCVVTKRTNGGYCWLLTRSPKESIVEVIKEAFTAYCFIWKIEECHRHIKECYNLEDIQIKTFEGLKSMLAILTIAMSIIYSLLSPCIQGYYLIAVYTQLITPDIP